MSAGPVSVLLLAGLCALVAAPRQISAQSSNVEPKYKLSGAVINSVTGEPVRRAVVQLYAGSQLVALSDGNGQFEFEGLSPGNTSINVHKPGFFDDQQSTQPSGPQVVEIGPEAKPVLLRLTPESVIYGHVQSADGEPLEHLPVKVVAARIAEGKKRWDVVGSVTTDEDGEFRIPNLTAGSYYVEAGPNWRFMGPVLSHEHPEGYAAVFYGGASDLNSAIPLQLGAGQQLRADFVLQTTTFFKVSGHVSSPVALPGVNLQFEDRLGDRFSFPAKFDRMTGEFQTAAPAGSFTLTANAWTQEGKSFNAEAPLNISSDISGVRLVPAPSNAIPVIVRTEATRSLPAAARRNQAAGMPLPNVHLRAIGVLGASDYWARPEGPNNRALASPDVPSGKYSLEVNTSDPWYVQSAHCAGVDLLREDLVVTAGVQPPPIDLVLRDDGATLSGKVAAAGQSRKPTIIVLLPEHSSGGRVRTAFAGADGDFTVQNLAPGEYSVFAFDHSDELEYANPDVLEQYIASAVHVSLQPNEEHTANLDVIHVGN